MRLRFVVFISISLALFGTAAYSFSTPKNPPLNYTLPESDSALVIDEISDALCIGTAENLESYTKGFPFVEIDYVEGACGADKINDAETFNKYFQAVALITSIACLGLALHNNKTITTKK